MSTRHFTRAMLATQVSFRFEAEPITVPRFDTITGEKQDIKTKRIQIAAYLGVPLPENPTCLLPAGSIWYDEESKYATDRHWRDWNVNRLINDWFASLGITEEFNQPICYQATGGDSPYQQPDGSLRYLVGRGLLETYEAGIIEVDEVLRHNVFNDLMKTVYKSFFPDKGPKTPALFLKIAPQLYALHCTA
jgi:hypothetical protein